jgi:hypothetical protein
MKNIIIIFLTFLTIKANSQESIVECTRNIKEFERNYDTCNFKRALTAKVRIENYKCDINKSSGLSNKLDKVLKIKELYDKAQDTTKSYKEIIKLLKEILREDPNLDCINKKIKELEKLEKNNKNSYKENIKSIFSFHSINNDTITVLEKLINKYYQISREINEEKTSENEGKKLALLVSTYNEIQKHNPMDIQEKNIKNNFLRDEKEIFEKNWLPKFKRVYYSKDYDNLLKKLDTNEKQFVIMVETWKEKKFPCEWYVHFDSICNLCAERYELHDALKGYMGDINENNNVNKHNRGMAIQRWMSILEKAEEEYNNLPTDLQEKYTKVREKCNDYKKRYENDK